MERIKVGRKDTLEDHILRTAMDSVHNRLRTRSIVESGTRKNQHDESVYKISIGINPYPTTFPYGNGMVLHFYQQQESSATKTVHKVINKGLKTYV